MREQRTVKVFRRKDNGVRRLLGHDVTRYRGRWRVLVDHFRGGYLAVVEREKQRAAGTIYVCKHDQLWGRFYLSWAGFTGQ